MGLNRELDGVLVVSIEQAVAAPYCGLLLADAGARVIKVERPEGDFARGYDKGAGGQSTFFAWLNRGKHSICLDLNAAKDIALLYRMLEKADVLLSNLAPGALRKRQLSHDDLKGANPRLISCDISGYGTTGEMADRKAYDFLVQAESGVCAVTGTADDPARVGISITDISTGLTAFSAILRGLIQRGQTGQGMAISISMFDVMADWMNMPLMGHRYLGGAPARLGLTHALLAPYGAYKTRDGGQILIAIQSTREWRVFSEKILHQPELGDDARFADNSQRVANRVAIDAAIDTVFSRRDQQSLIDELNAAKIACAQLSSVAGLSGHGLLRNLTVQFNGAAVKLADLPVQSDAPRALTVPVLDAHGALIRKEFSG